MSISLKNICYQYEDGTKALEKIDFNVEKGQFVALIASNGGGKTTLLKVIMGLLKPQGGEIIIDGQPLRSIKESELYQKVGLVFQNPNDQLFCATVFEDVAFGPRNLGLNENEIKQRVFDALEDVDMASHANKAIHHLSFGQQKRVCIAGILAMKPEILILDEPTAGLDPHGESQLMKLLDNLNRTKKMTIVMATHMVDLIPLFIDQIYVLNKGRLFKSGTAEKVFLESAFLEEIGLRMPYVSQLLEQMKINDGLPLNGLPLTIGAARRRLIEIIPSESLLKNEQYKD